MRQAAFLTTLMLLTGCSGLDSLTDLTADTDTVVADQSSSDIVDDASDSKGNSTETVVEEALVDISSDNPVPADGAAEIGMDAFVEDEITHEEVLTDASTDYEFVPLVPTVPEPAPSVRICEEADDPVGAAEKVFIDCLVETGLAAPLDLPAKDSLVVMAYNLERGLKLDGQVKALQELDPRPDVILASELDRGCSRVGFRHVTRELAEALEMDWAFAVEFVELRVVPGDPPGYVAHCEHGNAILSRYPLGNVSALRHAVNESWYKDPGSPGGEPRLGGRIAVLADVLVGDRIVHLVSLHLESAFGDTARTAQALEIANATSGLPFPVIVGGDLNSGMYFLDIQYGETIDPTVAALAANGFVDAHDGLAYEDRITSPGFSFVLDLILGRKAGFSNPAVGDGSTWDSLSDHRPVWATVHLGSASSGSMRQ